MAYGFCPRRCRTWFGGILFFLLSIYGRNSDAEAISDANLRLAAEHCLDELVPAVTVQDQPVSPTSLSDRMAALHVPGISVALIHDGKVVWAKGYGVTRLGGPAVTPDTLFEAGSISKMFTAMAILHLVQEGKLDLDVDVNQYLKSWKIPDNAFTARTKVTLRMLLSHTAGLNRGAFIYPRHAALPTLVQVLNGERPAMSPAIRVVSPPGQAFSYSNGGFTILQMVIENVTGQPYATYLQSTVLGPLGMTHSTFQQPLPESRLAEAATPYEADGSPMKDGPGTVVEEGAGGLWTTAPDLALMVIDLQQSLSGQANPVISRAMTKEMLTPGLGLVPGWVGHYGLGIGLAGKKDKALFTHGGYTEGFFSQLLGFRHGDGLIILTNGSGNTEALILELERKVAMAAHWPVFQPISLVHEATVDTRTLARYEGEYEQENDTMPIDIILANGALYSRTPDQPEHRLVAKDDHTFVGAVTGGILEFDTDASGKLVQAWASNPDMDVRVHLTRVSDMFYRHADPGVHVPPVRTFLDLSKNGPLGGVWCDGATLTARIKNGSIEYKYDSGTRYGCTNFFPSNVGPFVQGSLVDLRGYDLIQFRAKAPDKFQFFLHLSEAGSDKPQAAVFKGVAGTDGESWFFPLLTGTGKWETYTVELSDRMLRPEWGNQHGNHVLDLQAIDDFDFVIPGGQGKGVLLIKDLEFRPMTGPSTRKI
jgi:CubicO group peptidase (beta-lactamase class C family)